MSIRKPATTISEQKHYSVLTGLEISDPDLNHSPTYCVQIPNGLDGARPQAGLLDAEIVFEAQAEREVTRFAAIFQNPTSVIGPLRSLRLYYLEWDTPFDCTIVHAGGAPDALAAVSYGGYRDLTENYSYMYRGEAYNRVMNRYWNNLFTNANYFQSWATNTGFTSSNPTSFARLTPEASARARVLSQSTNPLDIDTATVPSVKELAPAVSKISFSYARSSYYDPVFSYNSATNTYDRSYASGHLHTSYDCDASLGNITPELACSDAQLSPAVVVATVVDEHVAAYDNYHEEITTTGSGRAVVFQNGTATEGTWEKPTKNDQIVFKDTEGQTISLAPGQTWISAIPAYGSISYE